MSSVLTFEQFINENLHLFEREYDEEKERDLEDAIKRYKALSDEIKSYREQFEEEIKPLTDEEDELNQKIINLMDELQYSSKKVDNIVAKYTQPHEVSQPKYKEAFKAALSKVNESTRKVLQEIKEQYTNIAEYSAKLKVQSYKDERSAQKGAKTHSRRQQNKINENVLKQAWDKVKQILSNAYQSLVGEVEEFKSAVDELEQTVEQQPEEG